jgi:hypothetical protein
MPAKKERNVKKRDPLRRKYGIPTLNDKKRHALRHPGFIAPRPVSHIEENQRRIAELESKLRDKSNGVVVGGTTVGGQVQPQPWVYKKPDAKESDPLSMVTNIAEKLGANSTLTTILKTAGKMSKADQETLLGYLNQGVNLVGQGIGAVLGAVKPAETEAQKAADAQAAEKLRAKNENTTPVVDLAKQPEPVDDGLPKFANPVQAPTTLTIPTTTVEQRPVTVGTNYYGYNMIGYDPNSNVEPAPAPVPPTKDELYLTNTSVAQHQNIENTQVESFTPAEIEQQRQSSVLPITYPKPISQPTSAAPTSAAQPVDNSEVSNLEYMKTVLLATLATSAVALQNFLFDNPILRETVQNAVVHGAKKIVDVYPYLRQYINGMPREQIRQRFRDNGFRSNV